MKMVKSTELETMWRVTIMPCLPMLLCGVHVFFVKRCVFSTWMCRHNECAHLQSLQWLMLLLTPNAHAQYRKKQKQKVVLLTSLVAAARSAPDAFTSQPSKRDTHEAKAAGPISTRVWLWIAV